MTQVRAEAAYTRNMGNYESLRVGFAVEDAVRNGETVDDAFNRVYQKVSDTLIEKLTELENALKE